MNPSSVFTDTYAFVTHVANDGFRSGVEGELSFDMQYRDVSINDPDDPSKNIAVARSTGFGEFWLWPHIAFGDNGGTIAAAVNGGNNFGGGSSELGSLAQILDEPQATEFGSMAHDASTDSQGSTYVALPLDSMDLMFVDYDVSLLYDDGIYPQLVASANTQTGEWIGTSQLAYAPDGTPGIVFTHYDGSAVYVKYAVLVGENWAVETVSQDPSTPDTVEEMSVIVDLAYDSTGLPGISYVHVDGTTDSLRFAIRGL
jgi:hypothetical protein